MKRIMLVFGTRPEAVKMAPVIMALKKHPALEPIVCLTAQHRSMLDQVMEFFGLQADIDLDLMRPNQGLPELAGSIMGRMGPVLREQRPDAVLVQGDTTSTLCGALAAFYERVPVGHIEAGLRTGNIHSPFPEEMNRLLTTRLAHWHFAPTSLNRENLLRDGVAADAIELTGNPVIDALLWTRERIERDDISADTRALLSRFTRPFILVTGHRRESFGPGFEAICAALGRIAQAHPEMDIVYPVHLNPNVQEPVRRLLGNLENIHLVEPQPYKTFVALMNRSHFILTDSGGVQEEAPSLGKPVLVMRDTTERTEALEGGVRLVGTDSDTIVAQSERLISEPDYYRQLAEAVNPYGDGTASRRICDILARDLCGGNDNA